MSAPTLLLFDEAMIAHDPGPGHPERPDRLRAIKKKLDDEQIDGVAWKISQVELHPSPKLVGQRLDSIGRIDQVADDHRGPILSEPPHQREPQSARASGDDRNST